MKNEINGTFNLSWLVYLIGIFAFGLCYERVKVALGGGIVFVAVSVVYLLILRFLGDFVGRKWRERKST